MASVQKVLIVGGGIGGLVSALALCQTPIDVEIVEVNPKWDVFLISMVMIPRFCSMKVVSFWKQYNTWRIRRMDEAFRTANESYVTLRTFVRLERLSYVRWPGTQQRVFERPAALLILAR